jgi:hypothetical protein
MAKAKQSVVQNKSRTINASGNDTNLVDFMYSLADDIKALDTKLMQVEQVIDKEIANINAKLLRITNVYTDKNGRKVIIVKK